MTATRTDTRTRVLSILLPALVLGLAAWWFCQMPPYAPRPLPSDWTPDCDQWDAEWAVMPLISPAEQAGLHQFEAPPATGEGYCTEISRQGVRISRVDLQTAEILASSAWLTVDGQIRSTSSGLMLTSGLYSQGPYIQRWLDPETLIQTGMLDLTSLPAFDPNGPSPIQLFVLHEMSDGTFRAIAYQSTQEHQYGKQSRWLKLTAAGEIIEDLPLPSRGGYWSPWPQHHPRLFLRSTTQPDTPPLAIDIDTGAVVEAPADMGFSGLTTQSVAPSPRPLPKHWNRLKGRRQAVGVMLDATYRAPSIFGFGERPPNKGIRKLSAWVGQRRLKTWRAIYGDEAVSANATRSIRVHDLRLIDARQNPPRTVSLSPELVESLSNELFPMHLQGAEVVPPGPLGQVNVQTKPIVQWSAANVWALPDERFLITHIVADTPADIVPRGSGILRLGVLAADGSHVDWLGWVELPEELNLRHPIAQSFLAPSIYRGQLLLSRWGTTIDPIVGRTMVEVRPAWTLLPIPPELEPLPEGWPYP